MARIEVVPATPDQQPILANLLELYAHDFSEFHPIQLDAEGRFGYPSLPLYWREPNRYPFLVRVDGKLAGFVLVKRESHVWDMTEFFIARGYRRHGIGNAAAHQVWRRFPGRWEVRVMETNQSALPFWERAISAFTGEEARAMRVEKLGKYWRVFSFESRPVK